MKHIFGPVPSRRLGRSLGIDVIPYKTCSFDCVYCECGATTARICERAEFFPLNDLLDELDARLGEIPSEPDVITLSGAGEPTLYSRMGELIMEAKRISGLPVAVITNSSLVGWPEVREELLEADIVLPSLDTADEETFQRMNRPHPVCNLDSIIDGLGSFLKRFDGEILFEILFLDRYNTDETNLEKLEKALSSFRTDRIQINTAVRPGAVPGIDPVAPQELARIATRFGPKAEIIAGARLDPPGREDQAVDEKILSLLKRRPCTARDLSGSLGIPLPETVKVIERLLDRAMIREDRHDKDSFYTSVERE